MYKYVIDSSKFKKAVRVCPECNGLGQTRETETIFANGKTTQIGSGCPKCKGSVAESGLMR